MRRTLVGALLVGIMAGSVSAATPADLARIRLVSRNTRWWATGPVVEIQPLGRAVRAGGPSQGSIRLQRPDGSLGPALQLNYAPQFDRSGLSPEEMDYVLTWWHRSQNGWRRTVLKTTSRGGGTEVLYAMHPVEAREFRAWKGRGDPSGRFVLRPPASASTAASTGSVPTPDPVVEARKRRLGFSTPEEARAWMGFSEPDPVTGELRVGGLRRKSGR